MFNESVADTLQYITFPLEVIGLSLAFIELRRPALAEQMARRIAISAATHGRSGAWSYFWQAPDFDLYPAMRDRWPWNRHSERAALWVNRLIVALPLALFTIGSLAWALIDGGVARLVKIAAILCVVLALALLFIILARWLLKAFNLFVDRWVPGRPVGTLGILVASLGVTGEFYQVLTQWVGG